LSRSNSVVSTKKGYVGKLRGNEVYAGNHRKRVVVDEN